MRKIIFVFALLIGAAFAESLDKETDVIHGALVGALGDPATSRQYIPEYGYHITIYASWQRPYEPQEVLDTMLPVLRALAPTIGSSDAGNNGGFGEDDWLSISYRGHEIVLVRFKPRDFETLEVWIDNIKQ